MSCLGAPEFPPGRNAQTDLDRLMRLPSLDSTIYLMTTMDVYNTQTLM